MKIPGPRPRQPPPQEGPHDADHRLVRGGAVPLRPAHRRPTARSTRASRSRAPTGSIVINRVSLISPCRISYRDRILRVPGVKAVTFATWFGGVYQDERNFFPQFVIDAEHLARRCIPSTWSPTTEWSAFLKDREGCHRRRGHWSSASAGRSATASRSRARSVPGVWEFNLRGIYTGARPEDDTTQFWFRCDYFEESGPAYWKGHRRAGTSCKVANPDDGAPRRRRDRRGASPTPPGRRRPRPRRPSPPAS